jgi:hypothetical protein
MGSKMCESIKHKDSDLCLETTVKEVLGLETQHVVQLELGLVQDTIANKAAQNSVTLKQTLGTLIDKIIASINN